VKRNFSPFQTGNRKTLESAQIARSTPMKKNFEATTSAMVMEMPIR